MRHFGWLPFFIDALKSDMIRFVLTRLHKVDWIKSCRKRENQLEHITEHRNINSSRSIYPFVSFSGPFPLASSQRLFVSAGLCRMILKRKNAPCWQTDKAIEDRRTHAVEYPRILCINRDLHMGWTYGWLTYMRVKLQQSGHTANIHPDTRLFACTHAWNSHRQLCLKPQTTVSSYISYRPCDLTGLCNHSPMTKTLSL